MANTQERLGILISGGGTTMEQMLLAIQRNEVPQDKITPAVVIASRPDAGGIQKASNLGIPVVVVEPRKFVGADGKVDPEGFGKELNKRLARRGVTIVTQNGWLPKTPPQVIDRFKGVIFNQHPGPVPETARLHGRQVHAMVIDFSDHMEGQFMTTPLVQRVDRELDAGAVVLYQFVPVPKDRATTMENDANVIVSFRQRVQELADLVLPVEHQLNIELLKRIVTGNIEEVESPGFYLSQEGLQLRHSRLKARQQYPEG